MLLQPAGRAFHSGHSLPQICRRGNPQIASVRILTEGRFADLVKLDFERELGFAFDTAALSAPLIGGERLLIELTCVTMTSKGMWRNAQPISTNHAFGETKQSQQPAHDLLHCVIPRKGWVLRKSRADFFGQISRQLDCARPPGKIHRNLGYLTVH
jgi:hypothetical protein